MWNDDGLGGCGDVGDDDDLLLVAVLTYPIRLVLAHDLAYQLYRRRNRHGLVNPPEMMEKIEKTINVLFFSKLIYVR